ncbi:MAG: hypothetical protein O6761_08535 [Thaumarchaeota archaeon]|nr:hypothetical protein [Nitrososphaerota archaeon]
MKTPILRAGLYFMVILIGITLLSTNLVIQNAEAYTDSKLKLDRPPYKVTAGEKVTFYGKLTTASGKAISGATIYIKDDDKWGLDDLIAKTVTGSNGKFGVTVIAKDWDRWSVATEIYAEFKGSDYYQKARSNTYDMYVEEAKPSTVKKYVAEAETIKKYITKDSTNSKYVSYLSLNKIQTPVYVASTLLFSGKLTNANGYPISGATVYINEKDFGTYERIASDTTNSQGYYSVSVQAKNWDASTGSASDIYAYFPGNSQYGSSKTYEQDVNVVKYNSKITLNVNPTTVNVGDTVYFSGQLLLDRGNPAGTTIFLKDNDPFDLDDLLARAVVRSDGTFSGTWIAKEVEKTDRRITTFMVDILFVGLPVTGLSNSLILTYAAAPADLYVEYSGNQYWKKADSCNMVRVNEIGDTCRNTIQVTVNNPYVSGGSKFVGAVTGSQSFGIFDGNAVETIAQEIQSQTQTYSQKQTKLQTFIEWTSPRIDSNGHNPVFTVGDEYVLSGILYQITSNGYKGPLPATYVKVVDYYEYKTSDKSYIPLLGTDRTNSQGVFKIQAKAIKHTGNVYVSNSDYSLWNPTVKFIGNDSYLPSSKQGTSFYVKEKGYQ